ncbi:MAG: riboflavin synthase [Phycisphaerales bacterium]|jgi:riboflavin synthase
MYTGLIHSVGRVLQSVASDAGTRLVVAAPTNLLAEPDPIPGESINIDGCCLSLVESEPGKDEHGPHLAVAFDVTHQTLDNTTLGGLKSGDRVHLERSCTPTTLLGGHLVQGHVDAVAKVIDVVEQPQWRIRIEPPPRLMPYVSPRGSICVSGVSLTIAELSVHDGWFEVALIPDTLTRTTLGDLKPGDGVNLECDCMVKALVHWQTHYADDRATEDRPQQPKA